jgi:hypothetical protein
MRISNDDTAIDETAKSRDEKFSELRQENARDNKWLTH